MNKIKQYTKEITTAYIKYKIQNNGFWFVDIPRTSSSSIRIELGMYYGIPYGKKNILEKKFASPYKLFHDHLSVKDMKYKLGSKLWNQLFTFTFVRNPWDRIFSFYFYRKKCHEIPASLTLKEYIVLLYNKQLGKYELPLNSHEYKNCADYILCDEKIDVKYIGRYENREHDLYEIASLIGWTRTENLYLQRSKPRLVNYKDLYDSNMIKMIERMYMKDIELFNYTY